MINVVARAGPADDETLTPDDAADVLEGLLPAQTKSYELGLKLKLTQLIHSKDIPADQYLRRILIEFLQLRPTWRVIVEAPADSEVIETLPVRALVYMSGADSNIPVVVSGCTTSCVEVVSGK